MIECGSTGGSLMAAFAGPAIPPATTIAAAVVMTARGRLLRGTRTPVGVLMDTYVALPKSFVNRRASCWCAGGAPRAEGAPVMRKVAERRFSAGEKRRDDR